MYRPLKYVFSAIALSGVSLSATGQSVAPMSQDVRGFNAKFVAQIEISNTYDTPQWASVKVFTPDWQPVEPIYLSNANRLLGPNEKVIVTALISFANQSRRVVYICNSITPRVGGSGQTYRGEVCGKVSAQRLR